MRARRSLTPHICLPALLLLASCAGGEVREVPLPDRLALELFEIAREEDPAPDRIDALFDLGQDDRLRAAVDLVASLPGGGSADYSVQLTERDGSWKIVWFNGPGVDWPERRPARGEGLSSSPAPGGASG